MISTPGAKTLTHSPVFEKSDRESDWSVAPTDRTGVLGVIAAGEYWQAGEAKLPFFGVG